MFAVEPKLDCPHFYDSDNIMDHTHWEGFVLPQTAPCSSCGDTQENWVCLGCQGLYCSRFINGHNQEHFAATNHCLALSLSDLSVWCSICDSYVKNSKQYSAMDRIYFLKFGETPPDQNIREATNESEAALAELLRHLDALPVVVYVDAADTCSDISSHRPPDCIICHEPFRPDSNVVIFPSCRHMFHRTCAITWLLSQNQCPICRKAVLEGWNTSRDGI